MYSPSGDGPPAAGPEVPAMQGFQLPARAAAAPALIALIILGLIAPAFAGTTGQLRGRVIDAATKAPLAGVKVSVASPSQAASTTTDASGAFTFISLSPDTYTVSLDKQGYESAVTAGISVLADQNAESGVRHAEGAAHDRHGPRAHDDRRRPSRHDERRLFDQLRQAGRRDGGRRTGRGRLRRTAASRPSPDSTSCRANRAGSS